MPANLEYSGDMERRRGGATPSSCVSLSKSVSFSKPSKRKHSPVLKPHRHQQVDSKKPKIISETETLTLQPDPKHSNHFRFTQLKPHRSGSTSTYGDRKWVFSNRNSFNYSDKVVFVSYNILGVDNASNHPDLYHNVPSDCLDWDCRKKLLYKEINHYNPSIICFQEVDHFNDLNDHLRKDGFEGVYLARTGEACDGCAIFWKNDLFTLSHQENIEYQRFGLRNNVAQLCVLKMINRPLNPNADSESSKTLTSRSLVVGNIHVLFNPKRGDIKLGQMRLFLEKAHKLSTEWGNIPVVVGGDFNSMPQSPMYQFLASAELDVRLHDRTNISGNTCPLKYQAFRYRNSNAASFWRSVSRPLYRWSDEHLRLATGSERITRLTHNLKLRSAYMGVPGSCRTRDSFGEPLATSYHSKFMGTVDYIWHTKELVPVKVLETLPLEILRKTGGLPSERWGSDHLAVVCELAFVDDEKDDEEDDGADDDNDSDDNHGDDDDDYYYDDDDDRT